MTVKMCIKYPQQQLYQDGMIRRKPIHQIVKKSETSMTANNGVAATFCRRVASQNNHPYLIKKNNNNHHGIDVARIRKAVSEIAAKEKNSEHFVPVKVEAVEAVKTEQGSGVDAFIAIMVHASKCK
jgi:hypothetical protein